MRQFLILAMWSAVGAICATATFAYVVAM